MKLFLRSLLIGLFPGSVLFAIGLFFAFSYGMSHGDGTPEWFGTLARALLWPWALLSPLIDSDSILLAFLETALGWAASFALFSGILKKGKDFYQQQNEARRREVRAAIITAAAVIIAALVICFSILS